MKILVLAGLDASLLNFRGPLLRAMVDAGHDVIAAAPAQNADVPRKLRSAGVRFEAVSLARTGMNPFQDLLSLRQLMRLIEKQRPEIVLSYTIKPVIYGSLSAWFAGVPKIYALITGLGAAFHTDGIKGWILRRAAGCLYKVTLRRCTRVFAQNKEIAETFVREGIVRSDLISVISGSGVDTTSFECSALPTGRPLFLYLGRLLRDKGVGELVAAARLLKETNPDARVLLVGDIDPNPASFSAEEIETWRKEGVVEFGGFRADVRPLLRECTALILPSYHEGLPRSVVEAMSSGRPVVTTDVIGCRETVAGAGSRDAWGVRQGDNGFLVPARSEKALAIAMMRLANDPALSARMGAAGRRIVEERFDVRRINEQMLRAMDLLPSQHSPRILFPIL